MLCDAKKYGSDDSVLYFLIDFIIARFAKSTSEKTEILFLRWMGKGVEEIGDGVAFWKKLWYNNNTYEKGWEKTDDSPAGSAKAIFRCAYSFG